MTRFESGAWCFQFEGDGFGEIEITGPESLKGMRVAIPWVDLSAFVADRWATTMQRLIVERAAHLKTKIARDFNYQAPEIRQNWLLNMVDRLFETEVDHFAKPTSTEEALREERNAALAKSIAKDLEIADLREKILQLENQKQATFHSGRAREQEMRELVVDVARAVAEGRAKNLGGGRG